ncbi:hypothetical protein Tco_1439474 [Tanacetum coccineum]
MIGEVLWWYTVNAEIGFGAKVSPFFLLLSSMDLNNLFWGKDTLGRKVARKFSFDSPELEVALALDILELCALVPITVVAIDGFQLDRRLIMLLCSSPPTFPADTLSLAVFSLKWSSLIIRIFPVEELPDSLKDVRRIWFLLRIEETWIFVDTAVLRRPILVPKIMIC